MKIILVLAVTVFCVCEAVVPSINNKAEMVLREGNMKSCLDYLKNGYTKTGFYSISINGKALAVYCDFKTEPGMAWTLVMSWSYHNNKLAAFKLKPFYMNAPVNEKTPNFDIYRLTLDSTNALRRQSTHWRATCSFQSIDDSRTLYRDYLRGNFSQFDIMAFNGWGHCKRVEYVNIRGHAGYHTTAKFWQVTNVHMIHIDSTANGCGFPATPGFVPTEDNFGFYYSANSQFRCTSHPGATTNWWFGGCV